MIRFGIYSLLVNLGLAGTKFTLSSLTGSLALRADGFHSLVDIFGSLAVVIGLAISGRKSRNFPWGLYKVENFASAIVSLILFFSVYEILKEAASGRESAPSFRAWDLAAVASLALVPLFFGRFEMRVGRKLNSPGLIADGRQFQADVLTSSIVFLALLAQRLGFPLDRIAAGLIAVFVGFAAWGLLVQSMRVLLDASIDRQTLDKIRSLIASEPLVAAILDLEGRNSGRYIFVEARVAMKGADLKRAHRASEQIERRIKGEISHVDRVLIHYEPAAKTLFRYIVALADRGSTISDHFGKSPYFALLEIDPAKKTILRQEVIANPHVGLEKGKGLKVAELLLRHKPDVVVTRESLAGKGPGYALAEAGTEIAQTDLTSLDELIDHLTKAGTP